MIHRTNRFHGRGSLKYLYKQGKTVRGPLLSLRYCPNERRTTYRLAVVVSRKVSKSAVVRNRIRRRLYENVRILSSDFTGVHDCALLVYDEKVATAPADVVMQEVTALFKKARLIKPARQTHAIVEAKE
jgi:ribonuclease P protein component